jgi:soluble lytic murein transglycosylase-like protein
MKCILFGLTLIVVSSVCSAAPGDSPALNDDDAAQLVELPAPPDLLPQMPALLPLFREAVTRIIDTHALIRAAAQKHRVPAAFISSIVAAESNFNPNALSPKGAIGLMQLMPATAQLFGADPAVPEQNVDAGTHYLRILMDKYHKYRNSLTRVIAAYNAGPGVVDRYHGVPPYRETKTYVARVLAFMKKYQRERA